MLDASARRLLAGPLDRPWVTPNGLTLVGLGVGLAGALAAGFSAWPVALVLWLISRLADGLDGPLARRRAVFGKHNSSAGGFLDIAADFTCYGGFVMGVAVGAGGSALPFLAVLLAYYINGTAFLAFSSAAERSGRQLRDGRTFSFIGGLAEGTETIIVHSVWCIVPQYAAQVAWPWAAIVGLGASQRVLVGFKALS
jgi:phosphatidylglycerophosphate synthase